MACEAPTFFLLLETGDYLLQEDGTSRLRLELATITGVFVCGATLPSSAQLYPPRVTQTAAVPADRACAPPEALPVLVQARTAGHVGRTVLPLAPAPSPAPRNRVCSTPWPVR